MSGALLLLTCVCVAQADSPKQAELGAQVRRLIRRLDDDELAVRQMAERKLTALGPDILTRLPAMDARATPEVKERLARIRQTLQDQFAEAVCKPTRVQLRGEMEPGNALKTIARQTGNQLVGFDRQPAAVKIQLDLSDVLFWEAFDKTLDQAGWTVDPFGGQPRTLTIVPRSENERPRFGHACYAGPFRFEVTQVTAMRNLRQRDLGALRLRLEISWEPRLKPISLSQPFRQLTARDDLQREIALRATEGALTATVEDLISSVEMDLPFQLPDRNAKQIESIKGTLAAILPGRIETFEFDDLGETRDKQLRRAGVAVTFQQLRKNEDVHEVYLRVRFDNAGGALESYRGWIYRNEAYVVDSKNERIDQAGMRLINQQDNELVLAYLFAFEQTPDHYKFVYKTPTLILRKEIQYELKDIPLP